MFSVEGFLRINLFLRGVYRIAYLNLLWILTTALGLVVFGAGPATYAVAAYIDGWFRRGETPPVTRAFIAHVRERFVNAMVVGWILLAATAVTTTNIVAAGEWWLQFANVCALVLVCIIAAYVFPIMAATDIRGILRQLASALLMGIGSLHWTLLAAVTVGGAVWLLAAHALPVLVLFGIGIPAAVVGFVTRNVLGAIVAEDAAESSHPQAGADARRRLHLARGTAE